MKKYLVGSFAIAVAIISFAFTSDSNKRRGCDPNTQYVWYAVTSSTSVSCANFNTIVAADLDLTSHTAPGTNPLTDLTSAGFLLRESVAGASNDALDKFGCATNDEIVCAVAYLQSDVNTTKFEKVTIGSTTFWRPKTGQNAPIPACAICKPAL